MKLMLWMTPIFAGRSATGDVLVNFISHMRPIQGYSQLLYIYVFFIDSVRDFQKSIAQGLLEKSLNGIVKKRFTKEEPICIVDKGKVW